MNHYFSIGKSKSFPLSSGGQKPGAARGGHTDTDSGNVWFNMIHGINYGNSGTGRPAWRIDVQRDIFLRVLELKKKKLGDDNIGDVVINHPAEKYNAFAQKPRINIICSFPKLTFFYNGWN